MFIWIPRYAYQITSNYNTSSTSGGNINIEFLKNKSTTSSKGNTFINASGLNNWNIHPAFTKYGGEELNGIWFAKFEATAAEGLANTDADNVTTKKVKVVPNVQSWRNIRICNMYTVSTNMKVNTSLYGIGIANCRSKQTSQAKVTATSNRLSAKRLQRNCVRSARNILS